MKKITISFLMFIIFVFGLLMIPARQTSAGVAGVIVPRADLRCLPTMYADMDMCPADCCSGPLDGKAIGAFASDCAVCGGHPEVSIDTTGTPCPVSTESCVGPSY